MQNYSNAYLNNFLSADNSFCIAAFILLVILDITCTNKH